MSGEISNYELTILYVIPSRNKAKLCSMRARIYWNHKIYYSFNVSDALVLFKNYYKTINPFDLVFIEYYLDMAEGIYLIEEIKKIDPYSLFIMYMKSSTDLAMFRKQYPKARYLTQDSALEGIDYNQIMRTAVEIKLAQLVNGYKEQEIFVLCSLLSVAENRLLSTGGYLFSTFIN